MQFLTASDCSLTRFRSNRQNSTVPQRYVCRAGCVVSCLGLVISDVSLCDKECYLANATDGVSPSFLGRPAGIEGVYQRRGLAVAQRG